MKVAIVHSYYSSRQPSGENVVVDAQTAALRRAGHDVLVVSKRTDDQEFGGLRQQAKVAWNISTGGGDSPTKVLEEWGPDVVHVHNLFPNWGRTWVEAWNGPVVATLHNFRTACAAGTFYRDGNSCTDCITGSSLQSVIHGCYRDSRVATFPLAIATRGGSHHDPLVRRADALVVLSERARDLHVLAGADADKCVVLPNFVEDAAPTTADPGQRTGWAYVGRLSSEKGVVEMVENWPENIPLAVYGDGPLFAEVSRVKASSVDLKGMIDHDDVRRLLETVEGLVLPSRWAEAAIPMSYVEALAASTPVLAWHGNGAADDIALARSGQVISNWREAGTKLGIVRNSWSEFSARARTQYEREYSEQRWLSRLEALYARAIRQAR